MRHLLLPVLLLSASAAEARRLDNLLNLPSEFENRRASYQDALPAGKETTLAALSGAGCIRHLWMTFDGVQADSANGLKLILRVEFDGSSRPAVEMPVSAFFAHFHGTPWGPINSPYLQVTRRGGLNTYFPMPFAEGARISVRNEHDKLVVFYLQADWEQYATQTEPLRFRADYRRENPAESYGKPFLFGTGRGRGIIAGANLGLREFDRADDWYHCGGDLVLLDFGTPRAHLLSGIGGEDFFGSAYSLEAASHGPIGAAYYIEDKKAPAGQPRVAFGAWRQFADDPIRYSESFAMSFGAFANDMESVLFRYEVPDPAPPKPELSWDVCGPFRYEAESDFEKAEFPEAGIDFDQSQPADFGIYAKAAEVGLDKPMVAKWKRGVPSQFRAVDLRPSFRSRLITNFSFPVNCSAYATTTIASRAARTMKVRVGHDDRLRIWVNGRQAYDGAQHGDFRTAEIELPLAAGENRILAKAGNKENQNLRAWVFLFDPIGEE